MVMTGEKYKRYSDGEEFKMESRLNGKKTQHRLVNLKTGKASSWYYHDNMMVILFDHYVRKGLLKDCVDIGKRTML